LNGSYTNVYTLAKYSVDIICYTSSKNASHGQTPEQEMFRGWTEAT